MFLYVFLLVFGFLISNPDVEKGAKDDLIDIDMILLNVTEKFKCDNLGFSIPAGISYAYIINLDQKNDHYVFFAYEANDDASSKIRAFTNALSKNIFIDKLKEWANIHDLMILNFSPLFVKKEECSEKNINPYQNNDLKNDSNTIEVKGKKILYVNRAIIRFNLKKKEIENIKKILREKKYISDTSDIKIYVSQNIIKFFLCKDKKISEKNQMVENFMRVYGEDKRTIQTGDKVDKENCDNKNKVIGYIIKIDFADNLRF